MNYTDIATLESAGLSDEQIAAVLSSVTVRPVGFNEFVNFLDDNGLASRHPINREWRGSLPAIATIEGHPLQAGIDKLFSHLNKPQSVQIDTTQQPWCLMAAELLAGLIQAGVITEQHREGFYVLGGGLRHGVVTAEQVAEARQQHLLDTYASQLGQKITAAINLAAAADGATEASVKAAAVAEASS